MTRPTPQGRLLRKYVVVLLVLVGGVLMASSLVELYFSYRETQRAIVRVERAKAVATAARIEQFLKEVEQQVRETTRTASDDPDASQVKPGSLGFREGLGAAMAEQRELDFLRVLRNVPAVAELGHLDLSGKEQLHVSRLEPDVVGSQQDFSRAPRFLETKTGKTYWSPVYLRNESEPYVTLAVPVGKYAVEVTTAEVSLGAVQKMVSEIEVGPGGYAYVVDSRNHLVAHPDGRMLRSRRDLSSLAQVKSARADRPGAGVDAEAAVVAEGLGGGQVLAAHAPIGSLGWLVFIERPAADAYAPLRAPIVRSGAIFVLGLGLSILASLLLARRMVAPIRILQEGATRIGAGTLDQPIDLRTGDEIEALAGSFNRMAASLKESYEGLEQKVEARTRELAGANRDLTEALEQQTATSEILRVISSSPTDEQPVFDAIVQSARRLCEATFSVVFLTKGGQLTPAAVHGVDPAGVAALRAAYPRPVGRDTTSGRAILDRRVVHLRDSWLDPEYAHPLRDTIALRSILTVPIFRDEVPIGAVSVWRGEVKPFTDKQIALLQTFADQAVIALENVRLFTELQARTGELARSVEELQALGAVSRAVSSTLDLETVLNTIVARAVELSAAHGGIMYEYDERAQQFPVVRGAHRLDGDLVEVLRAAPIRLGEGVAGKAAASHTSVQVADILDERTYDVGRVRALFLRRGYRSLLGVPLLFEQRVLGVLVIWRREPGNFAPDLVDLLQTFANQSVLAIENARLFREIEAKSREIEAASRHKSEFLANMSHELRTPLNAIIGFSEVLAARMFGEINDKQAEYLRDILESGQHLLSLINDILDLAKVEAGRMELEPADFDLPGAVENALILVRERGARRGITIERVIDPRLGIVRGDERKVKQVLLNLLSNALKFTPEGGRVDVRAEIHDEMAEISVADTGVGIAAEDHEAVFEEFRQVGTAAKTVEGTGLGLALSRKFVELHGGTIRVKSEVGVGSTFTFTLPLHVEVP